MLSVQSCNPLLNLLCSLWLNFSRRSLSSSVSFCWVGSMFKVYCMTLWVWMVTNISFHPTMSIHNQEKKVKRVYEIITKRKCDDLLTNCLNQFFKEICEDQSGEFVFGHLDLKGEQCSFLKISILTPLVYSSLNASQHLPLISFSCSHSAGSRAGMSRFGVHYNNIDLYPRSHSWLL